MLLGDIQGKLKEIEIMDAGAEGYDAGATVLNSAKNDVL